MSAEASFGSVTLVNNTPKLSFAVCSGPGRFLDSVLATRHKIQQYLDIMREIRHAIGSNKFQTT